jgi:ankyrin repeat protein
MDVVRLQARCHEEMRVKNCFEVMIKDDSGFTLAHKAVLKLSTQPIADAAEAARRHGYINEQDPFRRSPIHWAVAMENVKAVLVLLTCDADPNLRDWNGMTPLHSAASLGNRTIILALLSAGANVEARDKYGATPLHYGCQSGALDAVECLLTAEPRARIDARNSFGEGPLSYALRGIQRHRRLETFQALRKHGASLEHDDDWGHNLLLEAIFISSAETVQYLVRTLPAASRHLMPDRKTWLHVAACNADLETMKELLKCSDALDVDPDAVDVKGKPARYYLQFRLDREAIEKTFNSLIRTLRYQRDMSKSLV